MIRQIVISKLSENEKLALAELTSSLKEKWPDAKFILYGSRVRGGWDAESDMDLLIILPCAVSEGTRHWIISKVFDLNLNYGSNISALTVSNDEWTNGPLSLLPIHDSIREEGVPV